MTEISFQNYWAVAKKLKPEEREKYFSSLPKNDQVQIKESYQKGGWKDVFLRNEIDELCDMVKEIYEIDLYELRIDVVRNNKKFMIDKLMWDDINELFSKYETCVDLTAIFGGVHAKPSSNPNYYTIFKGA